MALTVRRIEGDVMKVNAFLVQGPRGTVVLDGMLTVSDAAKVRAALDASETELAGIVITHPHPDHYAGLGRQRRYIETFVNALERHADVVAAGDHTPVLAELRRVVPGEDLLFLADLSVEPMLAAVAGAG
jgi:glyoxylase-like metal-dependent hydrolase (beta-lactamase superfamily II)